MSAVYSSLGLELMNALPVLSGLRNASLRELYQSRAALSQLHLFILDSHSVVPQSSDSAAHARTTMLSDAVDAVPLLLGAAATALQHLQQQQCILQAPADDLALSGMICESLSGAVCLPSSASALRHDAQQQTLAAAQR